MFVYAKKNLFQQLIPRLFFLSIQMKEIKFLSGPKAEAILKRQIFLIICLTSLTHAKCGVRSTLCWKIPNISGSIELFAL